jgi:hypothetical protein
MKRDYVNQDHNDNTEFFVGYEVEHTPAHKEKTLFVVGQQPVKEILSRANALNCTAIYFGANMSFHIDGDPMLSTEWNTWEAMIIEVLKHPDDFWVTLDLDVKYSESLCETQLVEYDNFIPMISVKIPYLRQLNYNATLKIDDKDFEASNPGVWCHSLHELTTPAKFTGWKKYKSDELI